VPTTNRTGSGIRVEQWPCFTILWIFCYFFSILVIQSVKSGKFMKIHSGKNCQEWIFMCFFYILDFLFILFKKNMKKLSMDGHPQWQQKAKAPQQKWRLRRSQDRCGFSVALICRIPMCSEPFPKSWRNPMEKYGFIGFIGFIYGNIWESYGNIWKSWGLTMDS